MMNPLSSSFESPGGRRDSTRRSCPRAVNVLQIRTSVSPLILPSNSSLFHDGLTSHEDLDVGRRRHLHGGACIADELHVAARSVVPATLPGRARVAGAGAPVDLGG